MQNGITKGGARKLTKCVTALLNRSQILDEIILTLDESDDTVDTRKLMCDMEVGLMLILMITLRVNKFSYNKVKLSLSFEISQCLELSS